MFSDHLESPIGPLVIGASATGLTQVTFADKLPSAVEPNKITEEVKIQLQDYFIGKLTEFDVPLDFQGTDFQKSVWRALLKIPFGVTQSYLDIALQVSTAKAVRAVGAANGRNPIGIIVPCHRVIGSDGSLTGYAGGMDRKLWLLRHENAPVNDACNSEQLLLEI